MLRWKQLCRLPEQELGAYDIAEVNLACAEGLPGAEKIDHAGCLDRLDHCTRLAGPYTEQRMPIFHRNPAAYKHCEPLFRMICLTTLLRQACGVCYNRAKAPAEARLDTADKFIHGALMGDGGTCASLPVVYASVGRRLGYPLKLVECLQHCYLRWEYPDGQYVNIQANGRTIDTPSDDHYRQGVYVIGEEEAKARCYFQSKTPRMELARFLIERGLLFDQDRTPRHAAESFLWALALHPENCVPRICANLVFTAWRAALNNLIPPRFPTFKVEFPPRRFPEPVPLAMEQKFIFCEALERCLRNPRNNREWWEPLRWSNRARPRNLPVTITMTFHE